MTIEQLVEYAKEVGVPDRIVKEMFAPLIAEKGMELDEMEASLLKARCDWQAEYCKHVIKIIERNKEERKKRKKERAI
jgi:hypothetical protein